MTERQKKLIDEVENWRKDMQEKERAKLKPYEDKIKELQDKLAEAKQLLWEFYNMEWHTKDVVQAREMLELGSKTKAFLKE